MTALVQILVLFTIIGGSYGAFVKKSALLVVDVQKCFIRGGSLVVPDGESVVPLINSIKKTYASDLSVYFSLDYHPPNHISFASQHVDKQPFDTIKLGYNKLGELCRPTTLKIETKRVVECQAEAVSVDQRLWPDHCVIGSKEADLAPFLMFNETQDKIVLKGGNPSVDSYSAFSDNGNLTHTGLHKRLQSEGIHTLFVVGLATDYCVKFTAIDGTHLGYEVYVITDAVRGVQKLSSEQALKEMQEKGVHLITSPELQNILQPIKEHIDL